MKLEDTELNSIDFKDDRFRISYFFDLDRLKYFISESGLLNPVVVTQRDKSLVIVLGWRRALACRGLLFSSIPCFFLEEQEDLKAFQLAILENASMRDFSILELATILEKLKGFGMEEENILETYLPLFGIPQTPVYLDFYLAMEKLDDETKEFIHTRKVSFPVIRQLMDFNDEERAALLPHLRHLGQNKQKEFLEFLSEISKRDNISALGVMASEVIANVSRSTILSPSQKADKIRMLLRERRYPAHFAQEGAFDTALKKLEWPQDIDIDHSPFFEGENLSVRFSFKDTAEFNDKLKKLQKIASANRIDELLKSTSND